MALKQRESPESETTYRYAVLRLQADLRSAESVPLAIVVSGQTGVFLIGREVDAPTPGILQADVKAFPRLLVNQVTSVIRGSGPKELFTHLAAMNRWNIYMSPQETEYSSLPLNEVAHVLFARCVETPAKTESLAAEPAEPVPERIFRSQLAAAY